MRLIIATLLAAVLWPAAPPPPMLGFAVPGEGVVEVELRWYGITPAGTMVIQGDGAVSEPCTATPWAMRCTVAAGPYTVVAVLYVERLGLCGNPPRAELWRDGAVVATMDAPGLHCLYLPGVRGA